MFLIFEAFSFGALPAARAAEPGIDAQIAQAERERKENEQRLAKYRETIRRMKLRENDLLVRIDEKRQETERARQEVALLELQVRKVRDSVTSLNAEMARLAGQIGDIRLRLRQRLIDISKYGDTEALLLLFSAESTHEMLDSVYLLDKLSQYDQSLIEQLQSRMWEMELSRKTMEEHRSRLEQRMRALGRERQKFTTAIKETNGVLDDIRRQKALAERAAKEMEEAQRAVGQTILALMRQRKARDEAAKKSGKGQGSVDYLAGRTAQGRGSMFDWPLRGKISSPFGTRVHPVFRTKSLHSGIDIAAPQGTPVKAAAPGEVLFEGWMRGYGRVVVIDHGRDYSTVYAHMSSARVKEGTVVKAGTVIGAVGDTGTTTGYHLHFEVRAGSTAKNPLDYLKR
ncbi:MAG: peptidoglycan DD-metalloendopeptidase family protein [Synergistaceae bacterium]|nr:peptidoglycan DD-metalloendopeptidase family protein [Synergistaceae bacterium]